MRTMVGIDLVKSLVNFVFKNFDGYITGSLGPAGSQIRKINILNNFFYFAFCAAAKNSAPRPKNTESIALIKKFIR
jgi:hypothetical protein